MNMELKNIKSVVLAVLAAASLNVIGQMITIDAAADTDVRQTAPDYAKSDRATLSANGSQSGDFMKIYIKFELPEDFGTAVNAEFRITPNSLVNPLWTLNYGLFGLEDSAAGNDWPQLSPGTIVGAPYTSGLTWNNAPANDTSNGTAFTTDATGQLASFTTKGGSAGTVIAVSAQQIIDFLNSDTDKFVTFMVVRTVGTTTAEDTFASIENTSYAAPQLVLNYEPVPEPMSILTLLCGGTLAWFRRN